MNLRLVGEANDYVGKGIHGGEIIIIPPSERNPLHKSQVIMGNTCLYGATGGILLARGEAGERFAVRNSKAIAVVEGVGDHCCEYMTGGIIVVLGRHGRNIGAGMTGGLGYFLDTNDTLISKLNKDTVQAQRILTKEGENQLKYLLKQHASKTGSPKAHQILEQWPSSMSQFWQLVPEAEKNLPETNPAYSQLAYLNT